MLEFFTHSQLADFTQPQLIFSALVFIWSGFVRSGLGFGGAALGLPLMLIIYDHPVFWLPIIGAHLLIFTSLTLITRLKNVDWHFLRKSSPYIFPAKLIGVFGLLNLPNNWLVFIIYGITLVYAFLWMFQLSIQSKGGWSDKALLVLGGYVSGTSLTGAPLIVAVFMNHVVQHRLRDTLFLLWFILVTVKMSTFVAFSVDLHFESALILLPMAAIGHFIGLHTHDFMMNNDKLFKRVIGMVLVLICGIGFWSISQH